LRLVDFQHFYVSPDHIDGTTCTIEGDEFRHAALVLRKKIGDALTAIDGKGFLYSGNIIEMNKKHLVMSIDEQIYNVGESRLRLSLALSLLKGNHFEWVVEKGTELGIAVFQPMITEHTVVEGGLKTERRWQKALAAMKQSGRSICPEIQQPCHFSELLEKSSWEMAFIAHEHAAEEKEINWSALQSITRATLFVGPEGGFSSSEVETAVQHGVIPIYLGQRRLRSETAALAGAVKILAFAGDLG